jgi:hypothetical protein
MEKKIRDIRSEIIAFDGDTITLKLYDEIDIEKAKRLAENGRYLATLSFYDKNMITVDQRNHYFALVGDINKYTGIPEDAIDSHLKFEFMSYYLLDEFPSVADGAMKRTVATELITFVIEHCIRNGIPFRKQQFYLTADVNRVLYAMTMNRICWICGKPGSSIHHAVNLVGRGQDRTKFNHLKSKFMCLCESGHAVDEEGKETKEMASHHREADAIGALAFSKKYHVYPIKLSKRDLKQLGIRGNYEE